MRCIALLWFGGFISLTPPQTQPTAPSREWVSRMTNGLSKRREGQNETTTTIITTTTIACLELTTTSLRKKSRKPHESNQLSLPTTTFQCRLKSSHSARFLFSWTVTHDTRLDLTDKWLTHSLTPSWCWLKLGERTLRRLPPRLFGRFESALEDRTPRWPFFHFSRLLGRLRRCRQRYES